MVALPNFIGKIVDDDENDDYDNNNYNLVSIQANFQSCYLFIVNFWSLHITLFEHLYLKWLGVASQPFLQIMYMYSFILKSCYKESNVVINKN